MQSTVNNSTLEKKSRQINRTKLENRAYNNLMSQAEKRSITLALVHINIASREEWGATAC